jgi:serine protease inhibitor
MGFLFSKDHYVHQEKDLDLKFSNLLMSTPHRDMICSPLGVKILLGMVANGASDSTLECLIEFFGKDLKNLNQYNHKLMKLLKTEKVELENLLFSKVPLDDNFLKVVNKNYKPYTQIGDFNLNEINERISKNTHGLIQIDSLPSLKEDVFLLINCIYFSNEWKYPFTSLATKGDFLGSDGQIRKVDMMSNVLQNMDVLYYEDKDVQYLSLPYKHQKDMVFEIFLPRENEDPNYIDEYIDSLTLEKLNKIRKKSYSIKVKLSLPKFKFKSKLQLKSFLQQMGIGECFSPFKAKYEKLSDAPLYIDDILQYSFIEVDEEGTKAASVTYGLCGGYRSRPNPPKEVIMYVNRPFMFKIYDKIFGETLFLGVKKT